MDLILFFPIVSVATYCMLTSAKKQSVCGSKTRNGPVFRAHKTPNQNAVYAAHFWDKKSGHIPSATMKNLTLIYPSVPRMLRKFGCCCELCSEYKISGRLWANPDLVESYRIR